MTVGAAAAVTNPPGLRPRTNPFARAAEALTDVVKLIKTLITAAHVVGFDETTLRAGAAGTKKHVLSASTEAHTVFGLGGRDLCSFKAFGVLPAFTGVAVHDRYSLYDHADFPRLGGHQICCAHILRDVHDAEQCYPQAHWPAQATGPYADSSAPGTPPARPASRPSPATSPTP